MFVPIYNVPYSAKRMGVPAYAVLLSKGLYQAAPLFVLDTVVYAKLSSGHVRLYENKSTSHAKYTWTHHDLNREHVWFTETGAMLYKGNADGN